MGRAKEDESLVTANGFGLINFVLIIRNLFRVGPGSVASLFSIDSYDSLFVSRFVFRMIDAPDNSEVVAE